MIPNFDYDPALVEEIAGDLSMRDPVREAFEAAVVALVGDHDPRVPLVLDLATGVGKTYIMAGLVEYLARMGKRNVVIVTPSSVVQDKTVRNFTPGDPKFIEGLSTDYEVITPATYSQWRQEPASMQVFILNIQQLIRPADAEGDTKTGGKAATQRAARKPNESNGIVVDYLAAQNDLVVIADEHHLYSESAKAFQLGLADLDPAGTIGLTGSAAKSDHVIYRYSLSEAIQNHLVKRPVIAFRRGGYGQHAEEQQLRDALAVLRKKQQVYERYWNQEPGTPRRNAVLFVQCADVDHATDVTTLLAGTAFFGNTASVLQVDNAHNDADTLERLRTVDSPDSKVRAIVSVNKLREGWDAHNVAVMVTLRAMTSEVLTQQTLGRGLRLPFNHWTGVQHIDQLDVLAHDSFRRFLKAEDVLESFGINTGRYQLQPPPMKPQGDEPADAPRAGFHRVEVDSSEVLATSNPVAGGTTAGGIEVLGGAHTAGTEVLVDDASGVGVVVLDDDVDLEKREEELPIPSRVEVRVNEEFEGTTFLFPSSRMTMGQEPFRLSRISHQDIRHAVERVSEGHGVIQREGLNVTRGKLNTEALEDVEVEALSMSEADARARLEEALLNMREFEADEENTQQVEDRIVPGLMRAAGIQRWSIKAVDQLVRSAQDVIRNASRMFIASLPVAPQIDPVELPVDTIYKLPLGQAILARLDASATASDFRRGAHYGDWDKGLFTAAKFDSFSAEYRLAALLNRSPAVTWWKRLYPEDKATVAYSLRENYLPDFVVKASDGRFWIVEGKNDGGRLDETVKRKRSAAEETLNVIIGHPEFRGQEWGYVIAYESDVENAESWTDLLSAVDVVVAA